MASSSRSAKASHRAPDLVTVGVIVGPHGVRGELRVRPETDFPERFTRTRTMFLVQGDAPTAVQIASARPHGTGLLVTLDGITDRAGAEALRGAALAVPRTALMPLAADQYYVFDIVGLRVRTADGRVLGTVAEVLRGQANDIYVVRGGAREVLVPALREVVRRIDREVGEMIVTLPAGLDG